MTRKVPKLATMILASAALLSVATLGACRNGSNNGEDGIGMSAPASGSALPGGGTPTTVAAPAGSAPASAAAARDTTKKAAKKTP